MQNPNNTGNIGNVARHPHMQHLQQSNVTAPEFITGAISNRTLEQLTEAMHKPGRPIKADHKALYPL